MGNTKLITKFYSSFANANAEEMTNCYHDNIHFQDPAFGVLIGNDAKNMWRMLIDRNKGGINITFAFVEANETKGSVEWVAEYNFSKTGRRVINQVSAQFEFEDGKIIKHIDNFNMWKWSMQALGWKGYLLGWTSFMKKKIQKESNSRLRRYIQKQN
jgi:ketosteroid isomerase-like protein